MHRTALLLCLALPFAAPAQEDPDFQFLQSLTQTRFWELGRPTSIRVTPDGSAVLFLRALPRKPEMRLFSFDVKTAQARELITPEQVLGGAAEELSPEEAARRERMRVTSRGFTSYDLSHDGKLLMVTISGRAFVLPVSGGPARQVAGPGAKGEPVFDPRLSPDGKKVGFVRGGELWIASIDDGSERQITRGATAFVTHALAEFVAQEELRRYTGFWWSADSKKVVWEEADSTGVEKLWIGDPAHPEKPIDPTPYPRPGRANAVTRFGITSTDGGTTTWIDIDTKKWEYVARVDWQPQAPLTMELLTRDQKDLALVAVDDGNGKTRELLREHDDAWVEAAHDYQWIANGTAFLWSSESGGEWQLQLRKADGGLVRALTGADFGYEGLVHVNEETGIAVVERSPDPRDLQLYEASLRGGAPRPITRGPDRHTGAFSRDSDVWVRKTMSAKGDERNEVVRGAGPVVGELPAINEPYPFLPNVQVRKVGPAPGFFTSVVKPRQLDRSRKYPVWVQVYGGPAAPFVLPFSSRYLVDQWIADHGYAVVRIDNRGTTGRGHAWERAILGRFADVPLDDQVTALRALAKLDSSLDLTRIGIFGHSFGGFMSALAVERRPDVFHAAVASAPVVDWMNYDTAYTERYLGIPPPAGGADDYARNGLVSYAPELTRPLLIIHGTADDNVHFSESLLLADTLFRAGKRFEFLPLAGITHIIAEPGLQIRDWQRVFAFFEENLKRPR
jgi:dipeptidyl-peptidase 4